MNTLETEDPLFDSKAALPEKNIQVIVCCVKFRCLGFLDDEGIWRDAFHGEPLKEVVGWQTY